MGGWLSSWDEPHRALVADVARQCGFTQIRIIEDVSGESGARTFIVQPSSLAGPLRKAVLKIGPRLIVDEDAGGLQKAAQFYKHTPSKLADSISGDFRALLLDLAGDGEGTTFESFYRAPNTSPEDVQRIVGDLFRQTLRSGSVNLRGEWNPFAQYKFHEPERISQALRALGDGLPTLIRWWQRAEKESRSSKEPTYTAFCHGDLHRKNIIVSGRSALVIDFGLVGDWHAMHDFAKLERDICLYLYPSEAKSQELLDVGWNPGDCGDAVAADSPQLEKAKSTLRTIRSISREVAPRNWEAEYLTALLYLYILAAKNEDLTTETRKLALSYANHLRERLEGLFPKLRIPDGERETAHRRDVLWQFAYTFFRLDQLPSGGWAKSLPGWLDALFEGDHDFHVTSETRIKGGTDLTSRALITYLKFLDRLGYYRPGAFDPPAKGRISHAVRMNIADKIGDGGVGSKTPSRTAIHVRHTLMGLLTFLYASECTGDPALDELEGIKPYLVKNLVEWKKDKSHPFASFCILAKVREKLNQIGFRHQWNPDDLPVDDTLPKMSAELAQAVQARYDLEPRDTSGRLTWMDFRFRPYNKLWRMERSNLLMYLPFLITEDGSKFHEFLDLGLLDTCAREVCKILSELPPPDELTGLCLYNHQDPGTGRPRDFGLTAELLALLKKPAMKPLIQKLMHWDTEQYKKLTDSLDVALVRSFDEYHERPLFKFTHGVAFARYLEAVDDELINIETVRALDQHIDKVLDRGVTELDLNELCKSIVGRAFATCPSPVTEPKIENMRDLLVTKLVSGEHIDVRDEAWKDWVEAWKLRVKEAQEATIRFFDGEGGVAYAERYADKPIADFVSEICRLERSTRDGQRHGKALDVGCGPGQYASLLAKQDYDVDLADASLQMLKMAHGRLSKPQPDAGDLRRIERLEHDYKGVEFDLIFAAAMMVHIARKDAPKIYRSFHKLLRPGGALFVNFKIGDHTLIGIGERYYEYYRDYRIPFTALEDAGFVVHEFWTRFNHKTMYSDPMRIHWANFFCTRRMP